MRQVWLVAESVLIEAVRRKEIYALILLAMLLIGAVMTVDFFEIEGLTKFYREIALKIMSIATSLMVIVLACRQLPREFENRTIYPLLAKPVGRLSFLAGKLLGVILGAAFCFGLFMLIYIIGSLYLGAGIPWLHFIEYVYLQMLMIAILTTLCFFLSLIMNLDAALTMGVIFYLSSNVLITGISFIYDYVGSAGKAVLKILTFALPQLALFDFSGKTVHANVWPPLGWRTMLMLTVYALVFIGLYYSLSAIVFRRRAL